MNVQKTEGNLFHLNGKRYKFIPPLSVSFLLSYVGFKPNLLVIDYNGSILQKEFWDLTLIQHNDSIELLTVAGGG